MTVLAYKGNIYVRDAIADYVVSKNFTIGTAVTNKANAKCTLAAKVNDDAPTQADINASTRTQSQILQWKIVRIVNMQIILCQLTNTQYAGEYDWFIATDLNLK